MKKLTLLTAMLVSMTLSFGQRLMEGEVQANAGIGFNSGAWGVPIYAGVDYGIYPDITVGGILSYVTSNDNYGGFKNKGTWFSIGAKGDYHFNTLLDIPNEWDLYAGLTLAYNNFSYKNDWPEDINYNYDGSGIGLAAQIGARYYFQDNFGVNIEFGGGDIASGGRIGITYKF